MVLLLVVLVAGVVVEVGHLLAAFGRFAAALRWLRALQRVVGSWTSRLPRVPCCWVVHLGRLCGCLSSV